MAQNTIFIHLWLMLTFNPSDTAAEVILSLKENQTLTNNFFFLFVFTHLVTKTVVTKIFSQGDELSSYPDRFNQFELNVSTVFFGKPIGWWHYKVYEQSSGTNTNPALAPTLLEVGKMFMNHTTPFTYGKQESATTFSIKDSNG